MNGLFPHSANFYLNVPNTLLASVLIAGVIGFFWFIGKTDRVVYLGPGQVTSGGRVTLKTEPADLYVLDRDASYAAMKTGCRYDLNYAPAFGRSHRGDDKIIRTSTLVDCP